MCWEWYAVRCSEHHGSILLISHDAALVNLLCDQIYVFENKLTNQKGEMHEMKESGIPFAGGADGAASGSLRQDPRQNPARHPPPNRVQETPATEATEPAPTYAIDTLTVGTTAAIETAVFGEYNFDMLASGVSDCLWFIRTPRANIIRFWQLMPRMPLPGPLPFRTA